MGRVSRVCYTYLIRALAALQLAEGRHALSSDKGYTFESVFTATISKDDSISTMGLRFIQKWRALNSFNMLAQSTLH